MLICEKTAAHEFARWKNQMKDRDMLIVGSRSPVLLRKKGKTRATARVTMKNWDLSLCRQPALKPSPSTDVFPANRAEIREFLLLLAKSTVKRNVAVSELELQVVAAKQSTFSRGFISQSRCFRSYTFNLSTSLVPTPTSNQ